MWRPYSVADTAEVLLLELDRLLCSGVRIRIQHRYQMPGSGMQCGVGEEIASVELLHREHAIFLALPLSLLLVFEFLARSRHIPRSATQIAASIRTTAFYRKHGMNSGIVSTRKITRSAIKTYVSRLRAALDVALKDASIHLDAKQVLVSVDTVGNQTLYQLRAVVSWVHSRTGR